MNNEIDSPQQSQNRKKEIWKVLRMQFLILMAYTILIAIPCFFFHSDGFLVLSIIAFAGQLITSLILAIVKFAKNENGTALGHLVSLIVISILGFIWIWFIGILLWFFK